MCVYHSLLHDLSFFFKFGADPPDLCPRPWCCPALSALRMTFVFLQTTFSLPQRTNGPYLATTPVESLGPTVITVWGDAGCSSVCGCCVLVLGDSSGYKRHMRPISALVHRRPSPGAKFSCSDPPIATGLLLTPGAGHVHVCSFLCTTYKSSDTERHQ